jgi:hypothetical protein
LRLTTVGAYAHQELPADFQYLDVVVIDTPIADSVSRGHIALVRATRPRLERAQCFLDYLDRSWNDSNLASLGFFEWSSCAAKIRAEIDFIGSRL